MLNEKNDPKPDTYYVDVYVGQRMKERRHEIGLTLENLSIKIGVSHQQIHKYEQAESRVCASKLYKIAKILGVNTQYFFEGLQLHPADSCISEDEEFLNSTDPFNILILEDDPKEELLIRKALEKHDFGVPLNIHVVHTSHQALDVLSKKDTLNIFNNPNLFLVDQRIPRREGINILRSIKYNQEIKEIPVIQIAHNFSRAEMLDGYKNYSNGYIFKNGNMRNFEDRIARILQYWINGVCVPNRN